MNETKTFNHEAVSGEVCLRQFEALTFSVIIDSLLSGQTAGRMERHECHCGIQRGQQALEPRGS